VNLDLRVDARVDDLNGFVESYAWSVRERLCIKMQTILFQLPKYIFRKQEY
jgi:hypothetical protein